MKILRKNPEEIENPYGCVPLWETKGIDKYAESQRQQAFEVGKKAQKKAYEDAMVDVDNFDGLIFDWLEKETGIRGLGH